MRKHIGKLRVPNERHWFFGHGICKFADACVEIFTLGNYTADFASEYCFGVSESAAPTYRTAVYIAWRVLRGDELGEQYLLDDF